MGHEGGEGCEEEGERRMKNRNGCSGEPKLDIVQQYPRISTTNFYRRVAAWTTRRRN